MNCKVQNPWSIPDGTKLKHKRWGWVAVYVYYVYYDDWYLCTGESLLPLHQWDKEDFDII